MALSPALAMLLADLAMLANLATLVPTVETLETPLASAAPVSAEKPEAVPLWPPL